jgi:hypothetical protein
MIYSYTVSGIPLQTGDILCLAFDADNPANPGDYWRILGLLIPGEVDHVSVYVGPGGRCVEAAARGVYTFDLEDNEWAAPKMYKHRGRFKDHLVGVAYPLQGSGLSIDDEIHIRESVAAYCLAQAKARKSYNINLLNPGHEDSFYCGQLAYQAYLPHEIDLNTNQGVPNLPGTTSIVFPQEIWRGFPHKRIAS